MLEHFHHRNKRDGSSSSSHLFTDRCCKKYDCSQVPVLSKNLTNTTFGVEAPIRAVCQTLERPKSCHFSVILGQRLMVTNQISTENCSHIWKSRQQGRAVERHCGKLHKIYHVRTWHLVSPAREQMLLHAENKRSTKIFFFHCQMRNLESLCSNWQIVPETLGIVQYHQTRKTSLVYLSRKMLHQFHFPFQCKITEK